MNNLLSGVGVGVDVIPSLDFKLRIMGSLATIQLQCSNTMGKLTVQHSFIVQHNSQLYVLHWLQ